MKQKAVELCVPCLDAGVLPVGSQAGIGKLFCCWRWKYGRLATLLPLSKRWYGHPGLIRDEDFKALILLHLGDGKEGTLVFLAEGVLVE